MNFNNKLLCLIFFSLIIIISSGVVFAEDNAMPLIDEGSVSGDVHIESSNPWTTSGELSYVVPDDVSEIKSVNVVVNDYSGSGSPTYGLYSNVTLTVNNTTSVLGYESLVYGESTVKDPNVYYINNHTTRQYDSYQMIYNVTDNVKNLASGDEIKISVVNTNMSGYSFDGRIKLIALIFAYDDGDSDVINYWLNVGQSWTQSTRTNVIPTKGFDKEYKFVTFENIALSTYDATYKFNDQLLTSPIDSTDSHMFKYNLWNVTDEFIKGNDTNFTYTASSEGYASFKSVIQLLKTHEVDAQIVNASITPQYANTIFAGVNNTLTVNVTSANKNFNGIVKLMSGDEEIASSQVSVVANESKTVSLMDLTIRPIDETTVNGANNTKVNYTLLILDSYGNVLNSTNVSYNLLYNGNLGKDYAYPASNATVNRVYDITGDVIILNQDDSAYAGTAVTNRTSTWNVTDLDVNEALLYVSYNWDKIADGSFKDWNITFNDVAITPIANYRDQSNLGSYGKYGYGLVVYNVTDLIANGTNTLSLIKSNGSCAVYPATLLLLTDNNESENYKTVYIAENADLLSKPTNIESGSNIFMDVDTTNLISADLYVLAAGAQKGEGNIIFNNETYTDVWNGTSNSVAYFTEDIKNIIGNENLVYFQSTGSTVLALQSIIVCERNDDLYSVKGSITPQYSNTIFAGVNNTLTVLINNSNEKINGSVVLLNDGGIIDSVDLNVASNSTQTLKFTDSTIRPIDETTVNGANNTKANYTLLILDYYGNILNSTNVSYNVLYNGNLGKDYAYPASNATVNRVYEISGDVVILNQDDSAYAGTAVTNRTSTWNVTDLDVNEALLYVSYNWDKIADGSFKEWNVTFNDVAITPIANYRDQSNLGSYGKYGYGLVVYNVTDLIADGTNTLSLIKSNGSCAVYPATLLLLTDNNESETYKTVYIAENADLLSKPANIESGSYTFMDVDAANSLSADLYVLAASAQKGEGNIIFNNETYTDVWNGTGNSMAYFTADVGSIIDDENIVYFQATNSTILSLVDIIAVEYKDIKINVEEFNKYFGGNERFGVNLTDYQGNPLANKSANITINGQSYSRTSNENGSFSIAINLNSGTYPVVINVDNVTVNSTITVNPTIQGDNIVKIFKNGTQFYATFTDTEGNYLPEGTTVQFNINGVFYSRTIKGDDGKAKLNINLHPGEYIITSINPLNDEKVSNNITVLPNMIAENITKYYKNGTQYCVTLLDDNGNPVGEGVSVEFNINGVFYTRTTDPSGVAKLNINLVQGNYTITSNYSDCLISNNIEVLPILSTSDLTKKYGSSDAFVITALDATGNPYPNQNVTFNVNGRLYSRITDSSGQAKLNINLPAGEYIITSSYNDFSIANTITVTN